MSKSHSTSRSVRTSTKTVNGVTKRITEETIIGPDGKKTVTTTEEDLSGSGRSGGGQKMLDDDDFFKSRLGERRLHDAFRDDVRVKHERHEKTSEKHERWGDSGHDKRGKSDKKDDKVSPKTDEKSLKEFRKDALKAHNTKRSKHGASSLKLSDDLNKHAQDWAEHLAKIGSLQHSPCQLKNGDKLGENCATKWSSAGADYTGEDVTNYWYSEIEKYNSYGREPMSNNAGHFTQVIWKDCKEFGIGKASDGKGRVVVVGSYKPPGNVRGHYADNVLAAK